MAREKPLILVVDDDNDFRDATSEVLTAAGFDVVSAASGAEGVRKSDELMPDLILMDIKMPGVSGVDAALEIKQNPKTKNLKIVFLSGLSNPWPALIGDRAAIAKELGMEDYIDKTEEPARIVEKVKGFLAKQ